MFEERGTGFNDIFGPGETMDQLFGKTYSPQRSTGAVETDFGHHTAVYEQDQMVYVATLPGCTKEATTVEAADGFLQIKATLAGDGVLVPESSIFEATARIPERYDPAKAKATVNNGIF